MAKPKKYAAPKVEHVIEIHDYTIDAPRQYTVRQRTRSVNRERRALIDEVRELEPAFLRDDIEARDDLTEAQEDELTRKTCDLINLLCEPPAKDAVPAAGDLLFDQWENDQATDDDVAYYLIAVLGLNPVPN